MKEKLLKIKLPKEYIEDLFEYKIGLDNIPEWPEFLKLGWTLNEYSKFQKLVEIERMKYLLNEDINDNEVTKEEVKEIQQLIEEAIKEYNEM